MGVAAITGEPHHQCGVCGDPHWGLCLGQPWGLKGQEAGLLRNSPVHRLVWTPQCCGTVIWGT